MELYRSENLFWDQYWPMLCMPYQHNFSDIDECSSSNGGCHEDAACDNIEGSFTCTCQPGYSGDGLNCVGGYLQEVFSCFYLMGD